MGENSVIKRTHNWSLNHGGVPLRDSVGESKQKMQHKLLNMSTRSNKTPVPSTNIIKQNMMAVRNSGIHQLMNSTGPSFIDKHKYDGTSDSMAQSMTNYSKNRDHANDSINFADKAIYIKNKKSKKQKLPSLMDESTPTPRAQGIQFSTDFTKHQKKGKRFDAEGAGYDTDFTGGGGGFNSTYEDGFTGLFDSTNEEGDHRSTQYKAEKLPFMHDFPMKEKKVNVIKK